ncbi:MAG: hypothetical protein K5876_00430 [Ruminiclostridium sp.]|nr:hypothetical protein [Ruminiclostridium sp.]
MKRKITAMAAALCIGALMSATAYAQAPAEQIADGAGDVIENVGDGISEAADGIGEAAGDLLDGAGNAVDEITGGADTVDDPAAEPADDEPVPKGITAKDGDLVEVTGEDDAADLDEADDDLNDKGKIAEAELYKDNSDDGNPSTGGIPFMTAGLVAVTAAGVAYLTKKRNAENGQ